MTCNNDTLRPLFFLFYRDNGQHFINLLKEEMHGTGLLQKKKKSLFPPAVPGQVHANQKLKIVN